VAYAVSLLTPKGQVFSGDVTSIKVPGAVGFFGVQAGHAPMLAAVQKGVLAVVTDDEARTEYFIEDGILEMDGKRCLLLCDAAHERTDDDEVPILTW
jgi:F-type H+-transporting ATPase subunit epsilon